MHLAAIDIGTNSLHMIIVRVAADGGFEVIGREKDMVRLGAGGLEGRPLNDGAMDAALQTLARFKRLAESRDVDDIIAVATSAVREAPNGGDFLQAVQERTGIQARIITGIQEARLIHRAAVHGIDVGGGKAVVIDIGGGSTEITCGTASTIDQARSFRLGVIRLGERFAQTDPLSDSDERKLVRHIEYELEHYLRDLGQAGYARVIGTSGTVLSVGALALKHQAPLVARAADPDALAALTAKLVGMGVQDLVLELPAENPAAALQYNTVIRKMALKASHQPLGYPILNVVTARDLPSLVADASTLLLKYASILVVDTLQCQALLPLMMLRQNIYTDPQKPIQVEPKVYPIGEAGANSPVLVTTNFSLTYFLVSGEIENSGVPAHLAIVECEGMSVLTAWAAGKFSGAKVAAFLKASGLEAQVATRRLIIPGYVAQISGELEESLPGWEVVVGPQEASDLGPFLKLHAA